MGKRISGTLASLLSALAAAGGVAQAAPDGLRSVQELAARLGSQQELGMRFSLPLSGTGDGVVIGTLAVRRTRPQHCRFVVRVIGGATAQARERSGTAEAPCATMDLALRDLLQRQLSLLVADLGGASQLTTSRLVAAPARAIGRAPAHEPQYVLKTTGRAVVRAGPSHQSALVGELEAGEERRGRLVPGALGWFVLVDAGVKGYVHEDHVLQGPLQQVERET